MRRSTLVTLLSSLALFACSGGASTEDGAATNGASANGNGAANGETDTDGGPNGVSGGPTGSKGDAGAPSTGSMSADGGADADAAPVVTPDGCPVTVSPAVNPCVIRNDLAVFVSASHGSDDAGDGSMGMPFITATHATAFAKSHGKRVFLCAETYAEVVTLVDGVSIYGGLDCTTPQWTVSAAATRAHFNAPASPASRADNVQNATVVEAIEIVAPAGVNPGDSSIGMIATSSPALSLVNVLIQAQDAMAGAAGVEGVQLQSSGAQDGNSALFYTQCADTVVASCASGKREQSGQLATSNVCVGAAGYAGGMGGAGGASGEFESEKSFGGARYTWTTLAAPQVVGAAVGAPGGAGADGASATAQGAFGASGFNAPAGVSGQNGGAGGGGSGGSGYAPTNDANAYAGQYWLGYAGASGGAGGCPGLAGSAGQGGGASVAVIAIASSIRVTGSAFTAGAGGAGGAGTFGSSPTPGGAAGPVTGVAVTGGQAGGSGGRSGVSGAGAGGPSVAIAYNGGLPALDGTTTLTPGTGGAGQPAASSTDARGNAKTIPLSATGMSQAIYSF